MKDHYTLTRWQKSKDQLTADVEKGTEQKDVWNMAGPSVNWYKHIG